MMTPYCVCLVVLAASLAFPAAVPAYAHTTVDVEQYSIEAGWGTEPPVVGYRNAIVFEVTERGQTEGVASGVRNAFAGLDATIMFGGAEKPLSIGTHPQAGHYYSDIIPTRTGTYAVHVSGMLGDVDVSVEIPVEDVEGTAILDFPPKSAGEASDIGPIKQALSALQRDVAELRQGGGQAPAGTGAAYDFAVFGMSLGAAGIILGIISMLKRR